jgi:hypothetical protein
MRFDNDIAWKQLNEKGIVATLRNYPYKAWQKVHAFHGHQYEPGYGFLQAVIMVLSHNRLMP